MNLKKMVYWLPVVLSVLALPLALAALYMAIFDGEKVVYERGSLDSQEAADIAALALDKAEQHNETAGTILSLLEGGSVLLTLIVGAVAAIYTLNLRDLRSDLEGRADAEREKVEQVLALRTAELEKLTAELRSVTQSSQQKIDELTSSIGERLDMARNQAETSFKVLSLQLMAEQQVRARNYESAVMMLRDAHDIEPENQSTNYLLGYLFIAQRKFEGALKYLENVLQAAPNFAPALAAMGLAQRRLADQEDDPDKRNRYWAESEVNLSKALEAEPAMLDGDGESYYGTLGGLYRRQNRHDDAIRAYEKAVKVTPNSSYPIGNLAILYKYSGRDEDALEMSVRAQKIVNEIIEDRPGDHWARLDLAQSLLIQHKINEALEQYKEILQRKTPISALKTAQSTLKFLEKAQHPIPDLERVLTLLDEAIEREQEHEA